MTERRAEFINILNGVLASPAIQPNLGVQFFDINTAPNEIADFTIKIAKEIQSQVDKHFEKEPAQEKK